MLYGGYVSGLFWFNGLGSTGHQSYNLLHLNLLEMAFHFSFSLL